MTSRHYIHSDVDGNIVCSEYNDEPAPSSVTGAVEIIEVDNYTKYPPEKFKVAGGYPVEKSATELNAQYNAQFAIEVDKMISIELAMSDKTQVPDFPISDEERAAWRVYRQALRDLSDLVEPVAMIEAWPNRPDNVDPISYLRLRIQG